MEKGTKRIVLVIVAVALAVVLLGYHSSTLIVIVGSDHPVYPMTYTVNVDGNIRAEGILEPGQLVRITIPLSWWGLGSCVGVRLQVTFQSADYGPATFGSGLTHYVCVGRTREVRYVVP
ncbi:MAG TPA: hypothetical protein VF992_04230 [Thermoplasmata archaeon]